MFNPIPTLNPKPLEFLVLSAGFGFGGRSFAEDLTCDPREPNTLN